MNLVPLNPYKDHHQVFENFLENNLEKIVELALREHPQLKGIIREMNISKALLTNGIFTGMINIHVLNDKFSTHNRTTTQQLKEHVLTETSGQYNAGAFIERFHDERNRLQIQLTAKQFNIPFLGLHDMVFSYRLDVDADAIVDQSLTAADVIDQNPHTGATTSTLWQNPFNVLGNRIFLQAAQAEMTTWVINESDITQQTLAVM